MQIMHVGLFEVISMGTRSTTLNPNNFLGIIGQMDNIIEA